MIKMVITSLFKTCEDSKDLFIYNFLKTYVVGTQNNRLNETVLLSTQNIC